METTRKLLGFLLLLWITSDAAVDSYPESYSGNELSSSKNFVGISSQIIANALIQGQSESTNNFVSSPIGFATILSILSQGSDGGTRDEILQALELPNSLEDIRSSFRTVLKEYTGSDSVIAPQFKTWFYIYNGSTADAEYRNILINDFHVEVKDIERYDMDFDSVYSESSNKKDEYLTNDKDISNFDDFNFSEQNDEPTEIEGFDSIKSVESDPVKDAIADYDSLDKEEKAKVSKFDKEVDDKQYVEKFKITDELKKKPDEGDSESGPEKISLPTKKFMEDESMEIMDAQENRNFINRFGRAQPLHMEGDVTSALSGNSIMGKKSMNGKDRESKMLLFNGLYFRGEWQKSFKKSDETGSFYGAKEKQEVKFMTSTGDYKYAEISSQNLIAVNVPYKNDRYSLLVIMPKTSQDMKQFCKQSNYNNLNDIIAQMQMSTLELSLPTFRFECTSRAEKAMGKLGITTLFTSKADLKKISIETKGYQIEELVQHVAIRINEASSTESGLSAGNVQGRQNVQPTKLSIDKPFVFIVRDNLYDVILTAGKIMDVPIEEEIPVTFDI